VVALLTRLEHEQDPSGQVLAPGDEEPGGTGQHRHVGVVAAGVHGAIDLAGEVEPGLLGHGQRVHVGPQQDRGAGLAPGQQGGDARGRLVQRDVQPEVIELLEDPLAGDRQVVADLRMPVQVAPEPDCFRQQVLGLIL
jgi:hypothetical protein